MSDEKKVLCLLFDGFEEVEALTPVDLLRRAGASVCMAAIGGSHEVSGRSGIVVRAEKLFEETPGAHSFDLLILPGGSGVAQLRKDGRAAALARQFFDAGKGVAAICAAPILLKDSGVLVGRPHTAHFSMHDELKTPLPAARVVCDGRVITSRGAGTALDFALALVEHLFGRETSDSVSQSIMA